MQVTKRGDYMKILNPTSASGNSTISSAATSYKILPANVNRLLLIIQNTGQSGNLYVNFGTASYSNSAYNGIRLASGSGIMLDDVIPSSELYLSSDSAGLSYYLLECV